jgi:hypothetical protein
MAFFTGLWEINHGGVLAKEATEFLSIPPLPAFSLLCIK